MKLLQSLPFISTLLSTALADIQFTSPPAGAVVQGGHVVTAHWKDSGKEPRLSELTRYDLYLCAGGDTTDSHEEIATLIKEGSFARGNSVSFKIDREVGGNEENAYFLKMVATGPETAVTNYSPRFTLTDMTGSFSEHVQHGISSFTDLGGPEIDKDHEQEDLRKRQNVGLHTVPYQLQTTGATRYAPMAKKPGTAITAKTASPQYPTSSYTIATTFLPIPTVTLTLSATFTYSTISIENTAAPATQPTAAHTTVDPKMKRWLERWQD